MPKINQYSKGSIPYFAGDQDPRVFILQKGIMILSSIDPENRGTVTDQVKPGEFFGVKSALGHYAREETATSLSESTVVALTVPEFEKLVSTNKEIMMKMLRVFSKQLRQIHKKIESILNNVPEDQQTGMLAVAKSFYNEEQYRSCYDVCEKMLQRFPHTMYAKEVTELRDQAKLVAQRELAREYSPNQNELTGSLKQFNLALFDRFAKTYVPGQVIISEHEPGDTFYLIQSGQVQLLKCVNGTQKNLDILKAGEFFGEMAILDNSPRSATCMALDNVKCLEFSKENFESLITSNPQIGLGLLKLFCKRIYDQKRRFRILTISDLQIRIMDTFLMFDEMNPTANVNEKSRKFNVTESDIAHWAGLNLETTSAEISKLTERRKIEVFDNYMTVTNIADFKRLVESHTGAFTPK